LDGNEPVSRYVSCSITEEAIDAWQETSSGVEAMARVLTEPPPRDETSGLEGRKSRPDESYLFPRSLLDW
jgi:hypothetical protein